MHHHKLILFGVVLVIVAIFGFIFWDDLKFNQQELSNTQVDLTVDQSDSAPSDTVPAGSAQPEDSQAPVSSSDDYDSLDNDLQQTSLEIDAELSDMESEMSGL